MYCGTPLPLPYPNGVNAYTRGWAKDLWDGHETSMAELPSTDSRDVSLPRPRRGRDKTFAGVENLSLGLQ